MGDIFYQLKQFINSLDINPDFSNQDHIKSIEEKLGGKFNVHRQFFYIVDLSKLSIEYISDNVEQIIGYNSHEISVQLLYDIIHPDDSKAVLAATKKSLEFGYEDRSTKPYENVFRLDYRIRRKDEKYIKISRETGIVCRGKDENLLMTFGIITDISDMVTTGKVGIKYFGDQDYDFSTGENVKDGLLNDREIEVLTLISLGHKDLEISEKLDITQNTVESHRKNMLQKTKARNTVHLITIAKDKGLI